MTVIIDGTTGIDKAQASAFAGQNLSVNGIQFPATQAASADANCLDDYEEGSWTPVINASTTPSSGASTSVSGAYYVKVGKQVTVKTYCVLSTLGTGGSGWIKISGLPFANANDGSYAAISVGYFTALKANVVFLTGTIDPSGTWFEMRGLASAGAGTSSLDWGVYAQNGIGFIISATYITNN